MRRILMATMIVALMTVSTARAGMVIETFQYQNLSTLGCVISGSFTYDNSGVGPQVVSYLTFYDSFGIGNSLGAVAYTPLVTFDGTSLAGSFPDSINSNYYDNSGNVIAALRGGGTFSPPAGYSPDALDLILYRQDSGYYYDSIKGPVMFTGTSSSVPEPSSLAMCGLAGLLGLACAARRRMGDRHRNPTRTRSANS